jgi:hypothetical protein
MPALVAWIMAGLSAVFSSQIGRWIVSAFLFLGLELGTQKAVTGPMLTYMQSVTSGLSADAVGWLGFFNIDKYITIIMSAYATAGVGRVLLRRRSGSGGGSS